MNRMEYFVEIKNAELILKGLSDPKIALEKINNALTLKKNDTRALAYKYIALRGLSKFKEANKMIDFSNLVKCNHLRNYTNEDIIKFNKKLLNVLEKHPLRTKEKNHFGWAIRGGTVIRNLFSTEAEEVKKFQLYLNRAIQDHIQYLKTNVRHFFLEK